MTAITTLMLVSGFARVDGLIDVLDGAPEWWWVENLGDHATPGVVVVLELDRGQLAGGAAIDLELTAPSGGVVQSVALDPGTLQAGDPAPPGAPAVVPLVCGLDFAVDEVGTYTLSAIHRASGAQASCHFWLRLRPST